MALSARQLAKLWDCDLDRSPDQTIDAMDMFAYSIACRPFVK